MLSLYKLEIFNMVAIEGSFSKAAERLLLSQPAISQHMRDLEAALHVELFQRGPRGVSLTQPGEILLDYTRCILQMVAEAESAVINVEQLGQGQVSLGATPGAGVYLLPGWINSFHQRFPDLAISLNTDTTPIIAQKVLEGKIDLGFVEGELIVEHPLNAFPLREIRLVVVVGEGHAWWSEQDIALDSLHAQPFITRPEGSHTRTWVDRVLEYHQVRPQIVAEFDNPEAIRHAVASGMGLSIFPEWVVENAADSRLRALPIRDLPLRRTLKLIWNVEIAIKPAPRAFLSHLAGQFPKLGQLPTFTPSSEITLPGREDYRASRTCSQETE